MLQRSPTLDRRHPGQRQDRRRASARSCRRGWPTGSSGRKNILFSSWRFYNFCQRFPDRARKLLTRLNAKILGDPEMVAEHFTPSYDPWDQRFCAVPDADLFTVHQAR